jgi:hypothetical protein
MKKINRNNYEEFFLLYIDNELDVTAKEAVEKFALQNPDLAVELDMLLKSKCLPEEKIIFANKENLIRTEGNSINETNYQEYFLLYIDNELSAAKRREVEMYILQHPILQDDFTSLKQAVLIPEIISYSDKESLYRAENKRIVHLRPWRLAVAAAFIGLCAVGWWLLQTPETPGRIADIQATSNRSKQNVQPIKTDSGQLQNRQPEIVAEQTKSSPDKKITKIPVEKRKIAVKQNSDIVARDKLFEPSISANRVIQQNNIVKRDNEPVSENNDLAVNSDQQTKKDITGIALQQPQNSGQDNSSYNVYPVAYKELNTNDEDRSVHVAMLELNKDKVKGLLKKAGRLFSNKSSNLANEDGKLQVANFEIETKKQ